MVSMLLYEICFTYRSRRVGGRLWTAAVSTAGRIECGNGICTGLRVVWSRYSAVVNIGTPVFGVLTLYARVYACVYLLVGSIWHPRIRPTQEAK
jgi:hypothetical protein